jgi:hypothetical protein
MGDEPWCNLFSELAYEREVVCREVLRSFLVGHFKDANSMVTQFYRNKHHISDYLVKALINQ